VDENNLGPIDCPRCRTPMAIHTIGAVQFDRCGTCGGLWFDALEKERLLAHPRAAKEADRTLGPGTVHAGKKTGLPCPRDHSTLIHLVDPRQPHVGFESCTVCGGAFLDAGELTDLSEVTIRERFRSLFG